LGDERVTTQNLQIVRVDAKRGLLFLKGSVPGAEGGWVEVRDAAKTALPKEAPKPAGVRQAEAAAE
jgi:large subunit ribosomal protein L3